MAEEYFYALIERLSAELHAQEFLAAYLLGERSDFVRFNQGRVRQAGTVEQSEILLRFARGRRQATLRFELSGQRGEDLAKLRRALDLLREDCASLRDDPFLNYATEPCNSETRRHGRVPEGTELVDAVVTQAGDLDLVGLWSGGPIYRGFANSIGQRNWHSCDLFNFDWSVYHRGDKAVQKTYAGTDFDINILAGRLREGRAELQQVARPAVTLSPGRYRAYLAPAALYELLQLLAWGGFGLKSHRTAQTPLIRMVEQGWRLDERVTLIEDNRRGLAGEFTPEGFIKPDRVILVDSGAYADCLTGARSAKEYGGSVNSDAEYPVSLEVAAGELERGEILSAIGTGLYISNLWYCNYSDRSHCRITGMTRFASFWVEDGEIVGPVNAMRFDESLYTMLGSELEGLTVERDLLVSNATYEQRSLSSAYLPGILVSGFTLAL